MAKKTTIKKKKKKAKKKKKTARVHMVRVPFGHEGFDGLRPEFAHSPDLTKVCLTSRAPGHKIWLDRAEAVELAGLLNKLYLLDTMSQV